MTESIDTGAVQRITGVPATTLNVWISRQLIPGVEGSTQGKTRFFNLDLVTHIAITAALVKLGYGAAFSSMAASEARAKGVDRPGARLIIGPPRRTAYGIGGTATIDHVVVRTASALDRYLDTFVDGRPEAFTIIELDRIAERVRRAFEEPDLAERARRQRGVPARRPVTEAV
jgi:hypothetical protein